MERKTIDQLKRGIKSIKDLLNQFCSPPQKEANLVIGHQVISYFPLSKVCKVGEGIPSFTYFRFFMASRSTVMPRRSTQKTLGILFNQVGYSKKYIPTLDTMVQGVTSFQLNKRLQTPFCSGWWHQKPLSDWWKFSNSQSEASIELVFKAITPSKMVPIM